MNRGTNLFEVNKSMAEQYLQAEKKTRLKKRKDSLEIRAVLIEISMLSWDLQSGPKHR